MVPAVAASACIRCIPDLYLYRLETRIPHTLWEPSGKTTDSLERPQSTDVVSLMPSNFGAQAINMAEMAESQRTVKNLFQDDRFGEDDEEMSVEDKMLRRFQKERAVSL